MPDPVGDLLDVVLADGVVAARVVVGRVLLPADHRRRVEQLAVRPRRDLVDHGGLQVHEDGPDDDGEESGSVASLACFHQSAFVRFRFLRL